MPHRRAEPSSRAPCGPTDDPARRLSALIAEVAGRPTAFGRRIEFDEDRWSDCRAGGSNARSASRPSRTLHFTMDGRGSSSMPDCVRDFTKAYVIKSAFKGFYVALSSIAAMKLLGSVLDARGAAEICELTTADLDAAAGEATRRYCPDYAARLGERLEAIAQFVGERGLTAMRVDDWCSAARRSNPLADHSGPDFEAWCARSMPSPAYIAALVAAIEAAVTPLEIIVGCVVALLFATFSRIGQVLDIAEDFALEREWRGRRYLALRWSGSKGVGPQARFVLPIMEPLARAAIDRLREACAVGRAVKRAYDLQPHRMHLPPNLEYLRGQNGLTQHQVGLLLGRPPGELLTIYCWKHDIGRSRGRGILRLMDFGDVERHLLGKLGSRMQAAGGSEAHPLILTECGALAPDGNAPISPCLFDVLSYGRFYSELHRAVERQTGSASTDGTRSHSARHLGTTIAIASNVSVDDGLALFGRTDERSERYYNHVPNAVTRRALSGLADRILGDAGRLRRDQGGRDAA